MNSNFDSTTQATIDSLKAEVFHALGDITMDQLNDLPPAVVALAIEAPQTIAAAIQQRAELIEVFGPSIRRHKVEAAVAHYKQARYYGQASYAEDLKATEASKDFTPAEAAEFLRLTASKQIRTTEELVEALQQVAPHAVITLPAEPAEEPEKAYPIALGCE